MTALAAAGSADAPGALGFLVVFGMGIILFFVFRSMARHLRKVSGGTGVPGARVPGAGQGGPADPAAPGAAAQGAGAADTAGAPVAGPGVPGGGGDPGPAR